MNEYFCLCDSMATRFYCVTAREGYHNNMFYARCDKHLISRELLEEMHPWMVELTRDEYLVAKVLSE